MANEDVELESVDVGNGMIILIPKPKIKTVEVNGQVVQTSNEVSEDTTVTIAVENTVSFEFDIQPEFYLSAKFAAGAEATQEEYVAEMEKELCA